MSRQVQEQKGQERRNKALEKELEWVRPSLHTIAKSKARLTNYENLIKDPTPDKLQEMTIYIPPGPRLGDVVVAAENVRKAYGNKLLFDNLNFSLPRGGIVGVIGPNGAGTAHLVSHDHWPRKAR